MLQWRQVAETTNNNTKTTRQQQRKGPQAIQSQAIKRLIARKAQTYQQEVLDEKPVSYRELPREGRPQTLNATAPTASNENPELTRAKNLNTRPKKGQKIETTGGTRRSQDPTMPSFSSLRQRLPPPLHSTGTVYTHLTATHIEKTDQETDNPPEEPNPKPHSDPSN